MNTKPVQNIPTAPFLARLFIVMGEAFLPKDDHYVSREKVQEAVSDWENDTRLALYKMTSRYQQSPFAEMSVVTQSSAYNFDNSSVVFGFCSRRRILPTLVEIESMVKSASDKYQSTIDDYFTQSDLSSLLSCLAGERGRLETDVADRVNSFKASVQKVDRCFQFVGDMRVLRTHVETWKRLRIKHNFPLEGHLIELLEHIFMAWEHCVKEKDLSKIDDFFENINPSRTDVYNLLDQIIPKKKTGRRWDIASLIEGFEMSR